MSESVSQHIYKDPIRRIQYTEYASEKEAVTLEIWPRSTFDPNSERLSKSVHFQLEYYQQTPYGFHGFAIRTEKPAGSLVDEHIDLNMHADRFVPVIRYFSQLSGQSLRQADIICILDPLQPQELYTGIGTAIEVNAGYWSIGNHIVQYGQWKRVAKELVRVNELLGGVLQLEKRLYIPRFNSNALLLKQTLKIPLIERENFLQKLSLYLLGNPRANVELISLLDELGASSRVGLPTREEAAMIRSRLSRTAKSKGEASTLP